MGRRMLDQFSATIEKIYAAAADASLWEEALRAIEDYTGSTGAVLNLVPKSPTALPMCMAGSFSRDNCDEYARDYMWQCPRIAFGEAHPDVRIHYDRMILSEREMDRDPTYEWFGKHGLRYYVAGWIGESGSHKAYMSLQRSRRQGHVEPEQVDQFALVMRHMAQALALAVKLGTLDRQCRFGLSMLDNLRHAVFALDASGKVLLTNARAEALMARGDGLVLFNGRLQCRLPAHQPLLERLIGAATGSQVEPPQGGWLRIERASGRRPHAMLVSPIARSERLFGQFEPKALVIVSDPDDAPLPGCEALHQLFALTDAEAKVATALSGGHSIESAAASLHMQPATVRTHLKSVFRKIGVNRQQDLARLLTSLAMTAPPG